MTTEKNKTAQDAASSLACNSPETPFCIRPYLKVELARLYSPGLSDHSAMTKLLPARFTYTEFLTSSVGLGMSESTAKRLLKNALKYKLIEKQDDRYIIPADAPLGKGLGVNPEPK